MTTNFPIVPAQGHAGPLLNVEAIPLDEHTVCVSARGEVDWHTAPALGRSLQANLYPLRGCVLDLTEVTFFGTAGVRLLADWRAAAESTGIATAVALNSTAVRTALRLLDSPSPVPQFTTRSQAAAHVARAVRAASGACGAFRKVS